MTSSESNGLDVIKYNAVALIGPIQIYSASHFPRHVHPAIEAKNTPPLMGSTDQIPSTFRSTRWPLKIMTLVLDSDPQLIPRSSVLP